MPSRLRVAPKPTETKPLTFAEALKVRERFRKEQDRDPDYQALRLRGFAGLIRASEQRLDEVANLHEVAFFIAATLDDVAEALSPDVSNVS